MSNPADPPMRAPNEQEDLLKIRGMAAIVTGGGRGVGLAISKFLAELGVSVLVADNGSAVAGVGFDASVAKTAAAEISKKGGTALPAACDVSDLEAVRELVATPLEHWGRLDIVVNCAGNFVPDNILTFEKHHLDRLREVHIEGMLFLSYFAVRHWIDQQAYGRLINVASDAAMTPHAETMSYSIVKSAVIALTRSLALQLESSDVTANAITQISRTRMRASFHGGSDHPTSPEEDPATVAPLVAYLASPRAQDVSGRVFGSYGHRYVRWSEPHHAAELVSDGPWQLESMVREFPSKLL